MIKKNLCKKCKYYNEIITCRLLFPYENWVKGKCIYFKPKNNFTYSISTGSLGGDKIENDNYKTILRSMDEKKSITLSRIEISCQNFNTFKQIVEAITPILEKEDIKKCN